MPEFSDFVVGNLVLDFCPCLAVCVRYVFAYAWICDVPTLSCENSLPCLAPEQIFWVRCALCTFFPFSIFSFILNYGRFFTTDVLKTRETRAVPVLIPLLPKPDFHRFCPCFLLKRIKNKGKQGISSVQMHREKT